MKKIWIDDYEYIEDNYNIDNFNRHVIELQYVQRNLLIKNNDSHDDVYKKSENAIQEILALKSYVVEHGELITDDEHEEILCNINKMYENAGYAKNMMVALNYIELAHDENYDNGNE